MNSESWGCEEAVSALAHYIQDKEITKVMVLTFFLTSAMRHPVCTAPVSLNVLLAKNGLDVKERLNLQVPFSEE